MHQNKQKQIYFLKVDALGKTQIVSQIDNKPELSYRRIHVNKNKKVSISRKGSFTIDQQFHIPKSELNQLDADNPSIILKRLYDLYQRIPKHERVDFFYDLPFSQSSFNQNRFVGQCPFLGQISLYSVRHYKSMFVTQQFSKEGIYEMVINNNGRFQLEIVDDWVPVYEGTLQPIWGINLKQAWKIILLKFWAKKNKSYLKLKECQPFKFIQFTNSIWKYFNLEREDERFLNYYSNKICHGVFILKTKDDNEVSTSGLIRNSASYQLINIKQRENINNEEQKWVVSIKSTLPNKWIGSLNVFQQSNLDEYNTQKISLQNNFLMNSTDFFNLFNSAHITAKKSQSACFQNYYELEFSAKNKNAAYLQFNVQKQGWFNFSIFQFDDYRVQCSSLVSRLRTEQINFLQGDKYDGKRYLKIKYILVKDNGKYFTNQTKFENKKVSRAWKQALVEGPQYNPLRYESYQIQYRHGYSKGQAHFENIVPGKYYLRIKTQKVSIPTKFIVAYSSDSYIEMERTYLTKAQTSLLLRQTMISLIQDITRYSLDEREFEQIAYGNLFEQIGYGFLGVRVKNSCPYRILIEVEPNLVNGSGYKLKNQFKREKQMFSILVKRGESTSIVLKKVKQEAQWPPKGIKILQQNQKLKEPNYQNF